jgi:hypothetical protein
MPQIALINLLSSALLAAAPTDAEVRDVPAFTSIELTGHIDVVVTQSDGQSVRVLAGADARACIETRVVDEVLEIGTKRDCRRSVDRAVVHVSARSLEAIKLTGSGDITAQTGGAELVVVLEGSGDITVTGKVRSLEASLYGSGDISAIGLECAEAEVAIYGSGDVDVNVAESLFANVYGSGDVRYLGAPKVSAQSFGSGRIERWQ